MATMIVIKDEKTVKDDSLDKRLRDLEKRLKEASENAEILAYLGL